MILIKLFKFDGLILNENKLEYKMQKVWIQSIKKQK